MLKRVVLLAVLASMMGTVTSLAAWNTKHVDTEEELVITIPVSSVMLSGDKPKKK